MPIIIAVIGPSGAGKTTIVKRLCKLFDACHLNEDFYFRPRRYPAENLDDPHAVRHELLIQDLEKLKCGESIIQITPNYDHHRIFSNSNDKHVICASEIIIVEGLFLLAHAKLSRLFDFTIYIDAPEIVCLARRLIRDEKERQLPMASNLSYYMNYVRPAYLKYIEPYKKAVNLVINNSESHLENNLISLAEFISAFLMYQHTPILVSKL